MNWKDFLDEEFQQPYFKELSAFLKEQYSTRTIYPQRTDVFNAFKYCGYDNTKVVIIGQDPYHQPGQAHGLCFSVRPDVAIPPSLINIFTELKNDLGLPIPNNGYLVPWAKQGVLLLNAVLTVEYNHPNSHKNKGWEIFVDHVMSELNQMSKPLVFLLWGRNALEKASGITNPKHLKLSCPHPSPLSAYNGFFGCRHFSKANEFLIQNQETPIDWRLPDV